MQNFLKFILSRQMLAFVALLIIGALVWYVGPLLSFGELRPLETIGMRVTVLILLLVLMLCILLSWSISVVGVTSLCLLVWHGGPLLSVGHSQPLSSLFARTSVIAGIVFIYAIYGLYRLWQAMRNNEDLVQKFLHPNKDKPNVVAKEELKVVSSIVQKAITQLKTMRSNAGGVRKLFEGKRYLYELPWYMVIGSPGAGKTTAILNSGLKFPLAEQMGAAAETLSVSVPGHSGTAHCDWWFTNEAVLIDTAGRYAMQTSSVTKDPAEWHGFLALLRKNRTRAPINGAILMVNAAELLLEDQAERMRHAAKMRERLGELRAELGIQFPVYLIVTKADLLEGFNEYFMSMTSEARAQVWGFTLPYVSENVLAKISKKKSSDTANNNGSKVESGLKAVVDKELALLAKRIEDGLNTRMQEEFEVQRRRQMYALAQEFTGLSSILSEWVEAVFLDSRFDNTQLHNTLRGVYFTSAAQAAISVAANPLTLVQRLKSMFTSSATQTSKAQASPTSDAAPSDVEESESPAALNMAQQKRNQLAMTAPLGNRSYFLNDVFTKLIIPEAHLVRPNLRWEFRFRLMRLIGHAIFAIIGLWLISGLMISYSNNSEYLKTINEKTALLKDRITTLFKMNGQDLLNKVPESLTTAEELPLHKDLDLAQPGSTYGFGLYSGEPILTASEQTYARLQDSLLLPFIVGRIETVLSDAIAKKDAKTAYETLRIYLQLHDKNHYNAKEVLAWVEKDWQSGTAAQTFGGKASMIGHVEQLFSGDRIVQSPYTKNEGLVQAARSFLDSNTASQRLYERAKASMQLEAPNDFTLARSVGAQANLVFIRASGLPIDKGIPGLFTYDGYHKVFAKRLKEFVAKAQIDDAWVMDKIERGGTIGNGEKKFEDVLSMVDDDVLDSVRQQYLNEYADLWENYLNDIRTVTGTSLSFDLNILRVFASPDSPLSRLARAAARETTLSRALVTKKEEDKSLLDKANDQVSKNEKEVSKNLGLRSEQKIERELVDNRFSALRVVVTGQPDDGGGDASASAGGASGLAMVTSLLNDYYTFLTVANMSLTANTVPPSANDVSMKLKLEAAKLPAPFNAILSELANSGANRLSEGTVGILRAQAQIQVDRLLGLFAYQVNDPCKRAIEGRYPFAPSNLEVSIDDFTRIFAAGGVTDDFFQKQLLPYVDTSIRPWRYRDPLTINTPAPAVANAGTPTDGSVPTALAVPPSNPNQPTLIGETLALLTKQGPNPDSFAQVQAIRDMFFRDAGGKQMSWKMDVRVVEVDPSITQFSMSFDGQSQRYSHDAIQTLPVTWPGPRGGAMAEVTAIPVLKYDTSSISAQGPWAIFRLLDKARLQSTARAGHVNAQFSFDGRKAVIDLSTGAQPNPLASDLLHNFRCPGK